jgi:cyclopropane-fatty-acyl-phospholipid synthase
MRDHYRKTTEHWLMRLEKNEKLIRKNFGDPVYEDYQRYLSTCIRAFINHWQSLHQFSLRRLDCEQSEEKV